MDMVAEEPKTVQATSGGRSPGSALSADRDPEANDSPTHRHHIPATEKGPQHKNLDGAFDGSFAGTGRQRTEAYVKPWYLRSQYFTEGWTDTSIWRAAVSQ